MRLSALSFHHTIHGIWLRLEEAKTTVSANVVLHHTHDKIYIISSVQSLSLVQLFATPWTAAPQASLSITNSQSLLKFMSIK